MRKAKNKIKFKRENYRLRALNNQTDKYHYECENIGIDYLKILQNIEAADKSNFGNLKEKIFEIKSISYRNCLKNLKKPHTKKTL